MGLGGNSWGVDIGDGWGALGYVEVCGREWCENKLR